MRIAPTFDEMITVITVKGNAAARRRPVACINCPCCVGIRRNATRVVLKFASMPQRRIANNMYNPNRLINTSLFGIGLLITLNDNVALNNIPCRCIDNAMSSHKLCGNACRVHYQVALPLLELHHWMEL